MFCDKPGYVDILDIRHLIFANCGRRNWFTWGNNFNDSTVLLGSASILGAINTKFRFTMLRNWNGKEEQEKRYLAVVDLSSSSSEESMADSTISHSSL